ncbi:hypothetical protein BC831DRAFT_406292 [Entophlyctis helioformis]|nr:hypothetical protein BC831DRAFT_406292 [Entophlyctis helioformis]
MWEGWFKPWGTDAFQKRLAKYLLKQTIGRFLADEVDWDKYDFQLVNGQVTLRDLALETEVVNKALGNAAPIRMVSGCIGTLRIVVPWNGFFTEPCAMEVEDLSASGRSRQGHTHGHGHDRPHPHASAAAPPIMSSSFHFADGFIRTELSDDEGDSPSKSIMSDAAGGGGLSDLARMIENILSKVTLSLSRIVVRVVSPTGAALELSCNQLSLCDHTTDAIQNLIPSWLWMEEQTLLSNVVKYLRVLGVSLAVRRYSTFAYHQILSVPGGWLRVLFKQDPTFETTDMQSSGISTSSFTWPSSFDLASDFDTIGVALHITTIRDIMAITADLSAAALSRAAFLNGSRQSPVLPSYQAGAAHSPEPFTFTVRVGVTSVCLFHPNGLEPTSHHLDLLVSRGQPNAPSARIPDVDHVRIDIQSLVAKMQRHVTPSGEAVGIDFVISSLAARLSIVDLPPDGCAVLVRILSSQDMPEPSKLYDFVLNKTAVPGATTGFFSLPDELLRIRLESFKPLDPLGNLGTWNHHASVLLPPLQFTVSSEVLDELQEYTTALSALSPQAAQSSPSPIGAVLADSDKTEFSFAVTCPFIRTVIELRPPGVQRSDLLYPVLDLFSVQIGEDQPALAHDPTSKLDVSAGFLVFGYAATPDAREYRPLLLLDSIRLDLSTKPDTQLRRQGRFEDIVDSLHKLYRDNFQSPDDMTAKSWSDIGDDADNSSNGSMPKIWADSRAKHRKNHPFAALTVSSLKFTLHQDSGQSRRHDLSFHDFDVILSLNSIGSSKNSLAVELYSATIGFTVQQFLIGSDYHEQSVVCNQTCQGGNGPMVRLVFSQTDDFDIGLRQTTVTSVLDNFTLHLPFDTADLVKFVNAQSEGKLPGQVRCLETDLESFMSVHVLLTNTSILHTSSQPFRGASLISASQLKISTNIMAESPTRSTELSLINSSLAISRNLDSSTLLSNPLASDLSDEEPWERFKKYANSVGFVRVAGSDLIKLLIRSNAGEILPNSEIEVSVNQLELNTFPDSLNAAMDYFASFGDSAK